MSRTDNTRPFNIQLADSAGIPGATFDEITNYINNNDIPKWYGFGIGGSSGVNGLAQQVRKEYTTSQRQHTRRIGNNAIGFVNATEGIGNLIAREETLELRIKDLHTEFFVSSSPDKVVQALETAIAELNEITSTLDHIHERSDVPPIRGDKRTIPWDLY